LLSASAAFASTFLVSNVVLVLLSADSTPAELIFLIIAALVATIVFCIGILVVHAPVLGMMRAFLGDRLNGVLAGITGAVLAPGSVLVDLVILRYLTGKPIRSRTLFELGPSSGQSLLWLVPFCLGGVVFALEFASDKRARSETVLAQPSGAAGATGRD
jgi:hypothetical protein